MKHENFGNMKNGKLLIVDDNKSVLSSLRLFLKRYFEVLVTCNNPNQIPTLLRENQFDVVLLDMNFSAGVNNGNEGLYWLQEALKYDSSLVVILFTAYGDVQLAVDAMKYGASDFLLKPWDNKKLLDTLQNGVELHRTRLEEHQEECLLMNESEKKRFEHLLGESEVMQSVYRTIEKVAKTDANVLILGENGTGKELIAREIHAQSMRNEKVFVSVDLGSLSDNLFESEMFGHTKGAFTDAKEDREGRFLAASGGSIFLDEIGNLPLQAQAKLLTALQNRKITPLGSNQESEIDIRLITATNADINQLVYDGKFREDLLYRINTIVITLPALRDRGEDILLLVHYFAEKYAMKYQKNIPELHSDAKAKLLRYSWPGNIRELQHCMERAIILSDNEELRVEDFQLNQKQDNVDLGAQPISLEEGEKLIIANAMKRHKGNISQMARELNIGRQTLYRKIEKYEIF